MKKWYTSRTLLVNVIGVLTVIITMLVGNETAVEVEAILLGMVNLYLRLITSQKLEK